MTMTLTRRAVASLATVGTAAAVAIAPAPASAAPGDPVTGGTTTISVPASSVFAAASKGLFAYPTKPATATVAEDTNTVDYALPVDGGDAAAATGYGSINYAGSIVLVNGPSGRTARFSRITFSVEEYKLSATVSGRATPLTFATVGGFVSVQYAAATGSSTPTIKAEKVSLTKDGATYLNGQLGTTSFKADQVVGSFTTTYTNPQY